MLRRVVRRAVEGCVCAWGLPVRCADPCTLSDPSSGANRVTKRGWLREGAPRAEALGWGLCHEACLRGLTGDGASTRQQRISAGSSAAYWRLLVFGQDGCRAVIRGAAKPPIRL